MAKHYGIHTKHGKRVRFCSTVDLVNALEQEKAQGKAGRIATSLLSMDLVILDEPGYLPLSQAGGAPLLHLLSKLDVHTSVISTAEARRRIEAREQGRKGTKTPDGAGAVPF